MIAHLELERDPPPETVFARATDDERRIAYSLPNIEFDNEEAIHERTGEFSRRLVKVACPHCGRTVSPLLSTRTKFIDAAWRWVGLEYKEPYEEWLCACSGCGGEYRLTTHTPQ